MASELARHGVQCRILDARSGPVSGRRAVAVQARTLEVFDDMGVIQPFLTAGRRVHGASIFAEGSRILHFSFDELASPHSFALDIPQDETERILIAHLRTFGIEVERPVTVRAVSQDSGRVLLSVESPAGGSTLQAAYVIGCDGAQSVIRGAAGFGFSVSAPDETFLVADIALDWDAPDDEWYFWFHEDGLLSLFPLGDGRYRAVFDLGAGSVIDLNEALQRRGPKNARLLSSDAVSTYQVSRRQCDSYRKGRVFIAGDAAHAQSPAGGQGMNTGIQDAYNLAWKLGMLLRGNAPETLLDSYTAERQPVALSVATLAENLTSLAALRRPISQGIRNRLAPILASRQLRQVNPADLQSAGKFTYLPSRQLGHVGRQGIRMQRAVH